MQRDGGVSGTLGGAAGGGGGGEGVRGPHQGKQEAPHFSSTPALGSASNTQWDLE